MQHTGDDRIINMEMFEEVGRQVQHLAAAAAEDEREALELLAVARVRLLQVLLAPDSNAATLCGAGGARSVPRCTRIASPMAPAIVGPIALEPPAVVIRPK